MTRRCLETRRTPEGYRRRRYADGSKTIEVPLAAWNFLNRAGRGNDRAAAARRADERRALRKHVVDLVVRQGWKPLAASHETGVPVRTVNRWVAAA